MNIKVLFILFLTILISSCVTKDDFDEKRNELYSFCNKDIDSIRIYYYDGRDFYIKISNKKIINDFREIIITNTFNQLQAIKQFNYTYYWTLKTKNDLYTFYVHNNPYWKGSSDNIADINFFNNPKFDSYDLFKKVSNNEVSLYDYLVKYNRWSNLVQFRNYKLDLFIKKYIYESIEKGESNKYKIHVECVTDNPDKPCYGKRR